MRPTDFAITLLSDRGKKAEHNGEVKVIETQREKSVVCERVEITKHCRPRGKELYELEKES